MTTEEPTAIPGQRPRPHVAVVVAAAVAQLLVGFFYLTSGLAIPSTVFAAMLVWWVALTAIGVSLAIRGTYWLLLVPWVAAATLVAVLLIGGSMLGWTA